MTIALDLGTHAGRSLRTAGTVVVARRLRTIAAVVRDSETARTWLTRMAVPFLCCDEHLLLPGDCASQLAELFPVCCQDLLPDGTIPDSDPVSRQLIAQFVDTLLPTSQLPGELCCFAQPGLDALTPRGGSAETDRRLKFVSRLIKLRGYEPRPVNPAAALVLAEMEDESYTGVGVCLGASGIDVVLAHRGNVASAARILRGGRWVDEQLARELGRTTLDAFGQSVVDVEGARRIKEQLTLRTDGEIIERVAAELYRQLAVELVGRLEELLAANTLLVRFAQPLPVVCGGGPAGIGGFQETLAREIERRLPRTLLGTVRFERAGDLNVARGCLIRAELEGVSSAVADERISA